MLFFSKLLSVLVMPLGIVMVLSVVGLLLCAFGRRAFGSVLITGAMALLWAASTPVAARLAIGSLERLHPPRAVADIPQADVAIVLGGAVSGAIAPRMSPDLGAASDRILHTFDLFKAGKVRFILISGGNLPWSADAEPEAETIRTILVSWGVPQDAIIMETKSRTTAENAREVAAMWPGLGFSSALLVTSAFHMPRALATFRMAGINATPAATDVRGVDEPMDALDLLPDAGALEMTTIAMKEAVGLLVYRMRGELDF